MKNLTRIKTQGLVQSYIAVELDTSDGKRTVVRYIDVPNRSFSYNWQSLSPFLSYPDNRATKMTICLFSIYIWRGRRYSG